MCEFGICHHKQRVLMFKITILYFCAVTLLRTSPFLFNYFLILVSDKNFKGHKSESQSQYLCG